MALLRFAGLSRRIYLSFLLAAAVPTAISGAIGIVYSLNALKQETLTSVEQEILIRTANIARFFAQLSSELRFLSQSDALHQLHEVAARGTGESSVAASRERLEQDFSRFAAYYPHIYQIRYLGPDGRELVRVDRRGETIETVAAGRLQDKSDRYYVVEAKGLAPGDVYVSPLDLNIEYGRVERPERPVIRFATPVKPLNAADAGLLIVNLNADILLDQIQQLADARGGIAYLFDRAGHFLSRSAGGKPDTFVMQPIERLRSEFGETVLDEVVSGGSGTTLVAGQIFSFAPVTPLDSQHAQTRTKGWVLALAFPRNRLFLSIFNLSTLYIVLLASLAATALGGYLVSRRLLGPLDDLSREAEAVAAGDFTRRVRIEGDDEIAGLGERFNIMAERLQELVGKLNAHRSRLTDEVRARTDELDRERAYLAAVIQHTGDGILAVDEQGRCTLANDAARQLIDGLERHRPLVSWLPQWPGLAAAAAAAGAYRGDISLAGRTLALSVTHTSDGGGEAFIVVVRDVSEERRLLDERRELDRQMFQMEKMTTLGELAMGLAHEIGNPLAGLKAVTQSLRYESDTPSHLLEALGRMEGEIDRLSGFLHTFNSFAAPPAGAPVDCDLAGVMDDVLFWTRKEAHGKGIDLLTEIDGVVPLRADPRQMKQLLLNLVINAMHAMPEGGLLRIGARLRGAEVVIEVEDSGAGIPAEVLPRIFEPFYTTRGEGTGLGLAIVRKIAQDHHARVEAKSEPGQGTRFTLYWPAAGGAHV
ncbi:ATP-binding protein [Sedimenticola hydrogenitrophicus]|uniref:ATP-binding protein n=1 Tax=Sedimenticola hydrogenitrophicus TaxID=2967975 RepID=UPI0021A312C3|nr:ATP-binding protein [Sedimenticola hydrogenitrophicus]